MYNHTKYLKNIALLIIFIMSINLVCGCKENQEMKTVKEQELLQTEQEEEHAHSIEEPPIEHVLDDAEVQEINDFNDFQGVLIDIKSTHPGTAGCSIQILYNARDLLNFCKSKLALDIMAKAWIENEFRENYADINESFSFLLENLTMLEQNDDKKIFDENDIENDAPYDKTLYLIAKNVTQIIIDSTK